MNPIELIRADGLVEPLADYELDTLQCAEELKR